MSFTFICPNCRQKLEAEEEWLGMEAECPGCGKKIIVPKTVVLKKTNESDGTEATSKGNDGHNQSDVKGIVRQLYTEFHTANDGMFKGAEVSASKENNLRKTAQIPQDVKILLLIDNTVFGSAKNGMALTESGIYLHNDWAGKTSGSFFVSWKEFVKNGKECLKLASSNEVQIAPEIYLDTAGGGMGAKRIHKLICRLYEQMADQGTVLPSNESTPIPEMKAPEVAKESSSSEAEVAAVSSIPDLCGQPQPRYHLCPSPIEEKNEAASPAQGLPPSEPSVPPKSEDAPASPNVAKDNKKPVKDGDGGCGGVIAILVVIGIVGWLGWLGLSHWPRLSFWLLAPVTGVVVLAYSGKLPKLVTALVCVGIVFWGWKAHSSHPFSFRTLTISNVWVYADRAIDDIWSDDLESYMFAVYVDNKVVLCKKEYSHGIGYIPSYCHFDNPIKVRKGAKIKAQITIKIKRLKETTLTGYYYPKVTEDLNSIEIHCR